MPERSSLIAALTRTTTRASAFSFAIKKIVMCAPQKADPDSEVARARVAELNARAAIEARLQRPLSNAEWGVERARLLQFVTILRGWDQKKRNTTEFGNV
jgi:hypothetical protein